MAKTPSLTESHYKAIAALASGMTQTAAAELVDVSRVTITRWLKIPEFASELEAENLRRAERVKQVHQRVADQVQDEEIEALKTELQQYRQKLIEVQKTRIGRGLRLLNKVGARFDDLPEEAIGIKEIAALLLAGDRMVSQGLESWGDALAVSELLKELAGNE